MSSQSGAAAAAGATSSERFGVALMALGALGIPLMDAMAKMLGAGGAAYGYFPGDPAPALQIGWFRFAVQCVLLAGFAYFFMPQALKPPKRIDIAVARGLCLGAATICFFAGVQVMDLAAATAIFFAEPLFLTLMSALFLRESLSPLKIGAIALGFAGTLLVTRPSFLGVGAAALLPLGAAFFFASYLLLTKMVAALESAASLQFWAGLVGGGVLSVAMIVAAATDLPVGAPIMPNGGQLLGLVAMGVVGTVCHLLMVIAFRWASASLLAPIQYVEIISAVALGWLLFGESLDLISWAGVALVVATGLLVLRGASSREAAEPPR